MADEEDWRQIISGLRSDAERLKENDADAALMKCRKASEAIQYSIFEQKNGNVPENYLDFETMMSKSKPGMIGDQIPKPQLIEFSTIQLWGNYGSHFQLDGMPESEQVDLALAALDQLIEWRFGNTKGKSEELIPDEEANKLPHSEIDENELSETYDEANRWPLTQGPLEEEDLLLTITRAVELNAREGGGAGLSEVGIAIKKMQNDFKLKDYGCNRLKNVFKLFPKNFTLKQIKKPKKGGLGHIAVKLK